MFRDMMSRNRDAVLGGVVAVRTVEALASSAMLPFVVLWAHRDVGLGGVAAGLLFVGQALGEFLGGVAGGGLADRLGPRRVLLVSTAGMALGYGALALVAQPLVAIALFLAAGVFESAFHPTTAAIVGAVTPEDRLTHAFSLVRIGTNAGRIVGPMLGAAAAYLGLSVVFAVSGVMLALAVLVELAVLPSSLAPEEDDEPEVPPGTLRALRTDRRLALLVAGGGLLAISFTWWQADGLVIVTQQTPLGHAAYAGLFTLAALVVVLGQLPLNRLLRALPDGRTLLLGALVQAAGLAVLVAAGHGYAVLVVAVLLMALGEMAYGPTVSAVVTRLARPHQRASYQAALSITEDVATAVGPTSGLAVLKVTTAAGAWGIAALLAAAAGLLGRLGAVRREEAAERELSRA
jgi:MFS family permease